MGGAGESDAISGPHCNVKWYKTIKLQFLINTSNIYKDPNQDETFWNKFGTLGKNKKKAQEVKVVETEGKYAIDSPGMPKSAEMPPEVSV